MTTPISPPSHFSCKVVLRLPQIFWGIWLRRKCIRETSVLIYEMYLLSSQSSYHWLYKHTEKASGIFIPPGCQLHTVRQDKGSIEIRDI